MATNIINARLGCPDVTVWADWAWQYDYGQILKVSGVDLPDAYEVHFSNQETGGVTITQIGNADGVTVPDELLLSGADIFVWIFLHAGLDDGETVYKIVIPVKDRPQPSDEEPTPVEHSEITQTIAALNAAVEEAEEARQAIEDMTVSAETLPEGSSATVTKTVEDGVVNLDFGIPKGDKGDRGETGMTPDFSIGDVSTLPAGSYATASITGTTEAPVLNLGIPQGQQGENGAPGQTGPTGATPNLTIGTVSTLPAGSDATATITGTQENPVLSLGIPKGDKGDPGEIPEIDTEISSTSENPVQNKVIYSALLNKADVITDTASGSIVSIPDGMASPVLGLSVDIEPIQAGTGDPSPDNIRPISGRSEVNVYLEETYDAQATPKATIQLGQTVYGGTVDVTSGKMTITHKTTIADGTNVKVAGVYADSTAYTDNIPDMYNDSSYAHQRDVMVLCDKLKASAYINIGSTAYGVSQNGGRRFIFNIPDTTTVAQYNAWLQANTPTVYYLLADPIEVTMTAEELDILFGDNNIWADSGDTTVEYRCDTKKYILKKIAEALNA